MYDNYGERRQRTDQRRNEWQDASIVSYTNHGREYLTGGSEMDNIRPGLCHSTEILLPANMIRDVAIS